MSTGSFILSVWDLEFGVAAIVTRVTVCNRYLALNINNATLKKTMILLGLTLNSNIIWPVILKCLQLCRECWLWSWAGGSIYYFAVCGDCWLWSWAGGSIYYFAETLDSDHELNEGCIYYFADKVDSYNDLEEAYITLQRLLTMIMSWRKHELLW